MNFDTKDIKTNKNLGLTLTVELTYIFRRLGIRDLEN